MAPPDDDAAGHEPPADGGPLIFASDASAEAEQLTGALRARGYLVVDVPLGLLVGRVAVQRPALILCDVDADGALETVHRLRDVPGGSGVDIIFLGEAGKTLDDMADAVFHEGSGFFVRPVDVYALLRKAEALIGPPSAPPAPGPGPLSLPPSQRNTSSRPPVSQRARSSPPPPSRRARSSPPPSRRPDQRSDTVEPVRPRLSSQPAPPALSSYGPPPKTDERSEPPSSPPAPKSFPSEPLLSSKPASLPPDAMVPELPSEIPAAPEEDGGSEPAAARAPSLPPAVPLGMGADDAPLATTHNVHAMMSPELEQLLASAESRVSDVDRASDRLSPEEEVEAVLPADVLAALDEPLDDDDAESAADGDPVTGARSGTTGGGTGTGVKTGHGTGQGTGHGTGIGTGHGTGIGTGHGTGIGSGPGTGHGTGIATAHGSGPGTSHGTGIGTTGAGTGAGTGVVGTGEAIEDVGPPPSAAPRSLTSPDVSAAPATAADVTGLEPTGGAGPSAPPGISPPVATVRQQDLSIYDAVTNPGRPRAASPQGDEPPATQFGTDFIREAPSGPETSQQSSSPPRHAAPGPDRPSSRPPPEIPTTLGVGDGVIALARAIRARFSGGIAFEGETGIRRVVFREGDFVTAASGVEGESLVAFLAHRGDLPTETAQTLGRRIAQFGRHAGAALIAHGHLQQDQLWPVLRAHAEWIVGRAMELREGAASVERSVPGRLEDEPAVFGGATGAEVFVEVVRRVVDPDEAVRRLGGTSARLDHGPAVALLPECALGELENETVHRARGATVSEVLDIGDVPELPAVLYALRELGVLAPAGAGPIAAPREEPSSPSLDDEAIDAEALRARIANRMALVEEGDYFAVLGVGRNATGYDVRRAYSTLRRQFEPSRALTARTADMLEDVQTIIEVLDEAYDILRDEVRRERYRRAIEASP